MSYLKFDKNLLINLDQSLRKEILRTNQAGAYTCTSLAGCNTRKQHGLLVIPIEEFGNRSHVLLSSLDETVIQHGAAFNLGLHRYQGGVYSPNGHKYIREFDCESVPRTTFRVGGVILTREKIFISQENRILIRYTLVDAHSPTTLRFRPFLAFREVEALCVANDRINKHCEPVENGIATCLYEGFPTLYMQFSRKAEWVNDPNWYNGIEYIKDLERGVPYCEDLWVPGYFEVPIKKGESVIFSAGVAPVAPSSLKKMYESEIASRTPRSSFFNCLKNAAKQFYLRQNHGMYVISGYPFGRVIARNTFMAVPGLTLAIDHFADYEAIMATALGALRNYMDTGHISSRIEGIDQPDIALWALWAIQQYRKSQGAEAARKLYTEATTTITDWILGGGHPEIKVEESTGLLCVDGYDHAVSWMYSARRDGTPIVRRTGKLVEINALWYNGLRFAAELAEGNDALSERRAEWLALADKLAPAFRACFVNKAGYLYDFVDGTYAEASVRPNMAIAIGLDYSPLDRRERKSVLDVVTRELLTPKGLRTLSPKNPGYRPCYAGNPDERDEAMHNGPARPWLTGFYADAYLRVFGMSGVGYIDRMLIGFEDEMSKGCIGSLSQMYDGNPPYDGRGAVSHATNVAEVLRTLRTLKKFEHEM